MGGKSKTTQTTVNQPDPTIQPARNQVMNDGLSLYKNGGLVKPNLMGTVVPYANESNQMMGGMTSLANANMNGQGLSGQLQGIINNGGLNSNQQSAVHQLKYFSDFIPQEGLSQLNDIQRNAYDSLNSTANSAYDMNANPGFADVLRRAQEGSMYGSNATAAGMGRYGSGTHQGVQQRELGNLTANMVGSDYNQWLGRRDSAVRDIANLGGAANSQYESDMGRKMGATSDLFNAGQTAQGNLGAAFEGMKSPLEALGLVGSMKEDLAGRELNDRLRIASEQANAPFANLQALNSLIAGSGNYGTTTATAQGPSNTFSNLAGGALGGASLLSGGGKKI